MRCFDLLFNARSCCGCCYHHGHPAMPPETGKFSSRKWLATLRPECNFFLLKHKFCSFSCSSVLRCGESTMILSSAGREIKNLMGFRDFMYCFANKTLPMTRNFIFILQVSAAIPRVTSR